MSCFEKQEHKFPKMQDKFLILFNKNNIHSIKELKMLKQQLIDSKLIKYVNLIYININNKINLEKYIESEKFNEIKKCYIFDCSQDILNELLEKNIEIKDFQSLIISDILTNEKNYYYEEVFKCLIDDFSKFLGGPYLDCYEIDTDNGRMLKQQLIDSKLINYINLIYINVNNKINLEKYLESKKFDEVKKCYIFDCSQNILNKIFEKNIEVKDFQSLIIGDILTNEKKYYSEEVFKCLIDDFSKFLGGPYLDCYEIDVDNGRILKQKHDVHTILYYDFLFTDLKLAKLNANRILNYNYRVCNSDLIRYENVVKETKQKMKEIEEIKNENEKLEMTK